VNEKGGREGREGGKDSDRESEAMRIRERQTERRRVGER
jgi:hypothetical protein